jgi:RNA polymerase sigma-70 factor, ECF subfamily
MSCLRGGRHATRKPARDCLTAVLAKVPRLTLRRAQAYKKALSDARLPMAQDAGASDLLRAWAAGDLGARDALVQVVYQELRRRAGAYLRRERADHTLQPTALVHETFVRLLAQERVAWQNRAHFFGLAAQMMRRILVDHARQHQAAKRPGAAFRVSLHDGMAAQVPPHCELLLLDEALDELARLDARQARIVELKYFAGMSEQEVAAALSLSRATVTREWQAVRAWLFRRMTGETRRGHA